MKGVDHATGFPTYEEKSRRQEVQGGTALVGSTH